MSLSMVRKALDLYKDESEQPDKKAKTVQQKQKRRETYQENTKQRQRKPLTINKPSATLKDKKVKTETLYQTYAPKDRVGSNLAALKYMRLLNQTADVSAEAKKNNKSKKKSEKPQSKGPDTTAFTDEDFKKFFEEYNFK